VRLPGLRLWPAQMYGERVGRMEGLLMLAMVSQRFLLNRVGGGASPHKVVMVDQARRRSARRGHGACRPPDAQLTGRGRCGPPRRRGCSRKLHRDRVMKQLVEMTGPCRRNRRRVRHRQGYGWAA